MAHWPIFFNQSLTSAIVPVELTRSFVLCLCSKLVINQYFQLYTSLSFTFLFQNTAKKRLVYKRLWLEDTLCNNQFVFREHHLPEHVLALLSDKIYSAIDNEEVVVGIFIDLSKALDTVNHQILLDKFQHSTLAFVALHLSGYLK